MANKCLEEFNPWPSFVDIFSSVILVLLLFLLVLIVNVGYYAQFKFKIQYDGSIATDKIILTETNDVIRVDEARKEDLKPEDKVLQTTDMTELTTQAMQEYLTAATDIESAGEDLADKKQTNQEQIQEIEQKDRIFYVKFNGNEIFIDEPIIIKLKAFMNKIKSKYPNAKVTLSSIDPKDQVSLTVTKQISLGRIIATRTLIKKFKFNMKNVHLKLNDKDIKIPDDLDSKFGFIVVKVH
jgi:hypothetical protein